MNKDLRKSSITRIWSGCLTKSGAGHLLLGDLPSSKLLPLSLPGWRWLAAPSAGFTLQSLGREEDTETVWSLSWLLEKSLPVQTWPESVWWKSKDSENTLLWAMLCPPGQNGHLRGAQPFSSVLWKVSGLKGGPVCPPVAWVWARAIWLLNRWGQESETEKPFLALHGNPARETGWPWAVGVALRVWSVSATPGDFLGL